ncbi:hypothetical protein GN244_ATG07709 [Phytophthora infestans]|uniref:Uncharacterized protein n=1 Tax=Phytophthora infestans TaxID=4787 RepID=A0A833W2P9_PHYIN|nr:hypothetical protein GN244_ATG07709 [Phytophthora infestans]
MEGRGRRDAATVRRSGTFSGRQVPLEMGKVRVGGSGRPVPAVFSSVTSSRAASAAAAATLSPRMTLEAHPRSPFRRKEELSKTVIRVSEDSSSSGFLVKKVTGPHLSARSPQIRNCSTPVTRSAEVKPSRTELSRSDEGAALGHGGQLLEETSNVREQVATSITKMQQSSEVELSIQEHHFSSEAALLSTEEEKAEVSAAVPEVIAPKLYSENTRSDRTALVLPSAGAGTFVSSMPSLTKLQSSFTARELALFTQRRETSDLEGAIRTPYHVASHPHTTTTTSSSPRSRMNPEQSRTSHKRALPSSKPKRLSLNEKRHVESSWRRVDSSIDHIYEDPSIDMVQLHLLHSHNTVSGQKKRKKVERERVLAAASDLREHQGEEQRRQEELRQRKLQLQKMSEAIRLQNQRAVRARAAHSPEMRERRVKSGRRSESAPSFPERKPPVPRLSRSTKPHQIKRKKKTRDEGPRPQGDVSASILMGSTSGLAIQQGNSAEVDQVDNNSAVEHHAVKRKPPSTTPRSSKKKKQGATAQTTENEAAVRAKEERRAIAREYMQLQQHSRRIWNAKAKQQAQREQEKRQQQLEILEATRLRNLRASKKRPMDRKKYELDDPMAIDDSSERAVAIGRSSIPDISVDTHPKSRSQSETSRSEKELAFDEPQVNDENNQAIGNYEHSSNGDTGLESFGDKRRTDPMSEQESSQKSEADGRIRKLLELREKAAALTARLNGLRNRTDATMESPKEIVEQTFTGETGKAAFADEEIQPPRTKSLVDDESRSEQDSTHERGTEQEYEQQHECGINDKQGSEWGHDEADSKSVTQNRQDVQYNRVSVNAPDSSGMYSVNDGDDIDIRSIGVHSIGVVWPIQQQNDGTAHSLSENQMTAISSSSLSSSLSSAASPAIAQADEWLESRANQLEDNEGAFEVTFYQQLKNKLNASYASNDDETKEAPPLHDRRDMEEGDSNSDEQSDLASFAVQRKFFTTDQSVKQGRKTSSKPRDSSAGLMRLIRETDDSLSVIDRAAKKLYHEQLERSERERDNELQERMEAEKKKLLEKDLTLKTVMASITGKTAIESAVGAQSSGDESELQSSQYQRLEEIMAEVEKERAQETDENEPTVQTDELHSKEEVKLQRFTDTRTNVRRQDGMPVSPSSTFWDQLVAETVDEHPDQSRPHVEIDDSELLAQRESRPRDEDEHNADSSPRVHSPRTLSKRLMAAVDYQEAILEAHIQLSMMEHAHELETVQAETITLAQAFKEEMENNATSHQLALDHVTLEKKFDGDMQDVMQQLDTIRQVEEQERVATEARLEQELRVANLRECSVQTESSQRADAATSAVLCVDTSTSPIRYPVYAATSAALCVDTSTSPIRFAVDAAVQSETVEQKLEEASVAASNHELGYASEEDEEVYDETFETQSQGQVEQLVRDRTDISTDPSVAESLTHSTPRSESERESEIESELSDEADADYDEVSVANSVAYEESFAEESAAVSVVVSISDDEDPVNGEEDGSASVSVDNDEDFEASSPKMKENVRQMSQDIDEDHVHEKRDDNSAETGSRSIVSERLGVDGSAEERSDVSDISKVDDEEDFERENDEEEMVSAHEEEDQYDDDGFVSVSEDFSTQKSVVEAEVDESTKLAEKGKEDSQDSASSGNEYDEDFASASENILMKESDLASNSIVDESEIKADNDEDEKVSDVEEVSSGSDIAESTHESRTSGDEGHGDEIAEAEEENYSVDEFESGHLEGSTLPRMRSIHEEHSDVPVGQSSSEDSSMTKLLVAEVAALQEAAGATYTARFEESKLAKKKAKAEELIQAKDRLLSQQKAAFRHEEEKRQVDLFAKRALGVDVEGELRRAKDDISQQLASEFGALQETYPILQVSENVAPTQEREDVVQTPSVMSKLFGKSAMDISAVGEELDNDEYDAESFDEAHNDDHKTSVASDETDEVEAYKPDKVEEEGAISEVVSEAPSQQSDINEDVVTGDVGEQEDGVVNEQEAESDADYVNDYESEYENESFDEVSSVPDSLPKSGSEDASIAEENHTPKKSGHYDEDVYSEEAFDSASESLTNDAPLDDEAGNRPDAPITELTITEIVVPTEEMGAKEEELTEALAKVAAQLQYEQVTNPQSSSKVEPDHAEPAPNESKTIATLAAVSLSHSDEAESFTKSIEERTARLDALKQQIEDRKAEILAAQKQMRVERRRAKLVADEKLLWDEMESAQRLLRADEAALALCRQRNRLEMMHLEERQSMDSATRKPKKSVAGEESDLLFGFDYTEEAQTGHSQQRCIANMCNRGDTVRGFDLLEGYAYIETAEPNEHAGGLESQGAKSDLKENDSDAVNYDHGALMTVEQSLDADVHVSDSDERVQDEGDVSSDVMTQQETGTRQSFELDVYDENVLSKYRRDSLEHQATVDLLAEYAYVENADAVSDSQSDPLNADLLVGFDYVERVENMPMDGTNQEDMLGATESLDHIDAVHDEASTHENKVLEDEESVDNPQTPVPTLGDLDPRIGFTIEEENSSESVGKLTTNKEPAEDVKALDSVAAGNGDVTDESRRLEVLPDEESADRVTDLLYDSLLQDLEEDILAAIRPRRIADRVTDLLYDDLIQDLEEDIMTAIRLRRNVDRVTDLLYDDLLEDLEEDIVAVIRPRRTVYDQTQMTAQRITSAPASYQGLLH